jgi:hypothetical protein
MKHFRAIMAAALLLACAAGASAQQSSPFVAQPGATTNITVTASPQNLALAAPVLPGTLMQLALQTKDVTSGSCTGWVYYRTDGTAASVNADMGVRPGVVFLVSVPAGTKQLSVVGDSTGCMLYATVGAGE